MVVNQNDWSHELPPVLGDGNGSSLINGRITPLDFPAKIIRSPVFSRPLAGRLFSLGHALIVTNYFTKLKEKFNS